jgi:hypothetical protein
MALVQPSMTRALQERINSILFMHQRAQAKPPSGHSENNEDDSIGGIVRAHV